MARANRSLCGHAVGILSKPPSRARTVGVWLTHLPTEVPRLYVRILLDRPAPLHVVHEGRRTAHHRLAGEASSPAGWLDNPPQVGARITDSAHSDLLLTERYGLIQT